VIYSIDKVTRDALPLDALVERMDQLILTSQRERYGEAGPLFQISLPSELMKTPRVNEISEQAKRAVAYICFSYLIQLELSSVASGFANKILFTESYEPHRSWRSPVFRLREGAIRQYQIICARIAFELFIDLLHCIETGHRLRSKKSKLREFRRWLCDLNNPFHYFAHVLLEAYRFDRQIRTPEVHGTPMLPNDMLLMGFPDPEKLNEKLNLANALSGCWRPLIDILNYERPTYMYVSGSTMDWCDTYLCGTEEEIELKLATMFEDQL
jgi:hypothetical protein